MIHEKNTLLLYDKINVNVKVMEIVFRAFSQPFAWACKTAGEKPWKALEKLFIRSGECGKITGSVYQCHPYQLSKNHMQLLFSLLFANIKEV
jgi:hypothetical protein